MHHQHNHQLQPVLTQKVLQSVQTQVALKKTGKILYVNGIWNLDIGSIKYSS